MPGNTRRRKSKHQKGAFLSVLLVFFLVLQSMIVPFTAAYAEDENTDISSETEESDEALYDIPDEDTCDPIEQVTDDEPDEEEVEEEKEASEETPDEYFDAGQETEEENEIRDQLEEIDVGDNDPEKNESDENCEFPEKDGPDDDDVSGLYGKEDSGEEEKYDESAVYDAKAPPDQLEEEIQEKKAEADAEEEKSRRMPPEEEENTDSDGPIRSSAAGPEEMPRKIYRFHLSAIDLADTTVHHAEFAIRDQYGNTMDTLTLSDDNGWQTDWEHIRKEELTLTATEMALYDCSGNDITDGWISQKTVEDNGSKAETYSGWEETDALEVGTYIIEFGSGENRQLLAVDNPNSDPLKISGVKHWKLSREANAPENAPNSAIWIVDVNSYGCLIKNAALADKGAYLTARDISNKSQFALVKDESNIRTVFENHLLRTVTNIYLKVTSDGITGVTSADEATHLTVYRQVTCNDTVYESSMSFSHMEKPPPVLKTSVKVTLMVTGNVGERNRDFLFSDSVDGAETHEFSLSHKGEYVLDEIPIGSELTVRMEAPGYQINASFQNGEIEKNSLTVSGVPPDGGTLIFYANCDAELKTGIHTGSDAYAIVLTLSFFGLALQPLLKNKLQIQLFTRRKNLL